MKKKVGYYFRETGRYLMAFIMWLSFSAQFEYRELDDTKFRFRRRLKFRWYSPVFWLFLAGLMAFLSISSLISFLGDLGSELYTSVFAGKNTRTYSSQFYPEVPKWERRLLMWRYIYFD